eukprot:4505976-Pyramimonas_sp.AAC.1
MAATSSLDSTWQTFIHCAERYLLDAIGLKHAYHEFAGRERRPWLAVVKVLKPTAPRLPGVTATTSWCKSVAIALKDAAQTDFELKRYRALKALDRLCCAQPEFQTDSRQETAQAHITLLGFAQAARSMDLPQLQVASFIAATMADKLVQRDADKAKAGFADW